MGARDSDNQKSSRPNITGFYLETRDHGKGVTVRDGEGEKDPAGVGKGGACFKRDAATHDSRLDAGGERSYSIRTSNATGKASKGIQKGFRRRKDCRGKTWGNRFIS